jgi:hypothetical protein
MSGDGSVILEGEGDVMTLARGQEGSKAKGGGADGGWRRKDLNRPTCRPTS